MQLCGNESGPEHEQPAEDLDLQLHFVELLRRLFVDCAEKDCGFLVVHGKGHVGEDVLLVGGVAD